MKRSRRERVLIVIAPGGCLEQAGCLAVIAGMRADAQKCACRIEEASCRRAQGRVNALLDHLVEQRAVLEAFEEARELRVIEGELAEECIVKLAIGLEQRICSALGG